MRITTRMTSFVAAMFFLWLPIVCQADIAPEYPDTAWGRDEVPSRVTIIAVGAATSAAIVTLGLFLNRRPVHTATRKAVTSGVLSLALLVVVVFAVRSFWQADRDRSQWNQWEEERLNRRRNWRGPPQYENPPEPVESESSP